MPGGVGGWGGGYGGGGGGESGPDSSRARICGDLLQLRQRKVWLATRRRLLISISSECPGDARPQPAAQQATAAKAEGQYVYDHTLA